jgi:hypothetical protein
VAYQPETPKPLWAQQDCDGVVRRGVRERARVRGEERRRTAADIAAMCVSSLYGGAGIPVDEAMQPAAPVPDLDGPARHRARSMR